MYSLLCSVLNTTLLHSALHVAARFGARSLCLLPRLAVRGDPCDVWPWPYFGSGLAVTTGPTATLPSGPACLARELQL